MSVVAFKKKSVIQYGSKRSGKPPGGEWLPQGPFGGKLFGYHPVDGPVGFSLNGGRRNVGYIGKTYQMSKEGTPFRGQHPCWTSGGGGGSGLPVFNVSEVDTLGTQYKYIKPSVLSTRGMLRKKYRWAYNGQYPNYWVQPNYSGNQTDSASQGVYLQTLSAASDCVNDVNRVAIYVDNTKKCSPTLCQNTTARFKFNDMASNAPYTKTLYQPRTASQRTLQIQRKCANPLGAQKPFPFAVNGGTSLAMGGVNGSHGGNSGVCAISRINYLTPPAWYIRSRTFLPGQ